MVRLRREIEGIAINHALPIPAYALDLTASQLILPSLDERIDALEPGRILLAGVPTPDRARRLVGAGHRVTIADVASDEIASFNAQLGTDTAAKVTVMDKPYGESSFGPSSFDAVLLLDTLHRFAKPMWVAQKAFRELKFDGYLICRVWVHGPAPQDTATAGTNDSPLPDMLWDQASDLWRSKARRLFLDARGRDAIEVAARLRLTLGLQRLDGISLLFRLAKFLTFNLFLGLVSFEQIFGGRSR